MKRIIVFAITLAIASIAKAQLIVDENGKVTVNTTVSNAQLQVGRTGTSTGEAAAIESNYSSSVSDGTTTSHAIGLKGTANGTSRNCGVVGIAWGNVNGTNCGIFGGLNGSNGAAIFGSTSPSPPIGTLGGQYAGFFYGPISVSGSIRAYGSVQAPAFVITSGALSNPMTPRGEDSGNPISTQLKHLTLNTYFHNTLQDPNHLYWDCEAEPLDPFSQQVLSKQHYGLNADQLEEVFPDLVYENEDGSKSINYVEMVPILVQAINELSAKVETLEGESTAKKAPTRAKDTDEIGKNLVILSLGQNKPNPFGTTTSIDVTIPDDVQKAFIYIYDLQGKKVDQVDITARGKQTIQLNATTLSDGMYLYSLIADGKVVETRRMIVEK